MRTTAQRKAATFARNYGERGGPVRAMPCLCVPALRAWDFDAPDLEQPGQCSLGPIHAAHVIPRGMGGAGGDRRQLVPLCARHHAEAGEGSKRDEQPSKRVAFELRYGLNMKDAAARIAAELDERDIP